MSTAAARKRFSPSTAGERTLPPENSKKRRVDQLANSASVSPSPCAPSPDQLPDLPLLFHSATSAHNSASYHLQQAFVPADIEVSRHDVAYRAAPHGRVAFSHDPKSTALALQLLVMALDLLRVGLSTPGMSDKEHGAFGLEFATVAFKVLKTIRSMEAWSPADRTSVGIEVDVKRLEADVGLVISKSLAAVRTPHLKTYRHGLELASAELSFMQDRFALGKRIIKKALADTPSDDFIHRYRLILLSLNSHMELNSPEVFGLTEDLETEAEGNGHAEVMQIAHLARLSAMIRQRRWDSLLKTLQESAKVLDPRREDGASVPLTSPCSEVFFCHFLILCALVQGRAGQDDEARSHLKRLYALMDAAASTPFIKRLRQEGGILQLSLPSPTGSEERLLFVQSTPVNVLYASAYLATVVARRDVQGTEKNCRTLSYSRALRASEMMVVANDIWDCGFSPLHGLADVAAAQLTVNSLRVEVMMEEAFALICRNAFREANELLQDIAGRLRQYRLYNSHGVQLTLLHGQLAHTLGLSEQAARYYEAAQVMLAPGSELRLIVDIGLLAVRGLLEDLHVDHNRAAKVQVLADQCRSGSNRALHGVGLFLSSLADPERVSSKRQLSHAYEISRKGNPLLHCMIFAFTSSTHVYGDRERLLKLIEAGATLAHLLGGRDRPDGVGQAVLGLWFAVKLRDYHRVSGQFEKMAHAESVVERHTERLGEIRSFASERFLQ